MPEKAQAVQQINESSPLANNADTAIRTHTPAKVNTSALVCLFLMRFGFVHSKGNVQGKRYDLPDTGAVLKR